jgi:hypothetical protein
LLSNLDEESANPEQQVQLRAETSQHSDAALGTRALNLCRPTTKYSNVDGRGALLPGSARQSLFLGVDSAVEFKSP